MTMKSIATWITLAACLLIGVVTTDAATVISPPGRTGATGASGANGAAGASGADGKNACDVDVCASGCDYTSIGTATSTEEEGATICVKDGDYDEASTVTVKGYQRLSFGAVEITLADGAYFRVLGPDTQISGRVTLTGIGGDSPTNPNVTTLARFEGANIDTIGAYFEIEFTNTASAENVNVVQITATDSAFGPIWLKAISNNSNGNGTQGVIVYGANNFLSAVTVDGITDTGSGSPTSTGFGLYNADCTCANVNIGAIVTTSGNNGTGVFVNSDVTNSAISGVTLGSDSATLTNSGGATNKTANLSTS